MLELKKRLGLRNAPLVNYAEPLTPPNASQVCVDSDNEQFEECLTREIEIENTQQSLDNIKPLDPYDNDNDSVYDENLLPDWRRKDRPCIQAGCFYRPNQNIEPSEMNNQLGHRPNGTFDSYYKCDRCGRIMCNECVYYKMRHLNHFKHVKSICRTSESEPIPIAQIVDGII